MMSQQNHPNGVPSGNEPWAQQSSNANQPRTFPFGEQAPAGSDPQQGPGPQAPQFGQQPQAPQFGSAPAPYESNPGTAQFQPQQFQPQQGSAPGPYQPQAASGNPEITPQVSGSHPSNAETDDSGQVAGGQPQDGSLVGEQGYQGILDPRTGEIHPVPDLNSLHDSDALLVVVSGPDAGAQILLDTDVVTVGRSPNADIFLDDVTVSRKHAEFVRTPAGFTLRDTGSLNGTYVGRQLIDSIELQNGADVQIGKFRMIFQQRPKTA